ncbi:hypothetical protein FKM82_022110 [Ascaphus truei]
MRMSTMPHPCNDWMSMCFPFGIWSCTRTLQYLPEMTLYYKRPLGQMRSLRFPLRLPLRMVSENLDSSENVGIPPEGK